MSEQERVQESVRKEIRALLISAKDGLSLPQLEKEYLLMMGGHLPLRALGYRSTMELLLDMPDVVSICPCRDGNVILKAIPDEATKGMASLVSRQRSSHKVRSSVQRARASMCPGPGLPRRLPYRGRVPPILPAVVKSELKDLLALSPVLLSDFEVAFAKRFGRSFQYVQYGFLSMFEVLSAASDVISVEQTRAGSLLMLKKGVLEERHRRWPAGKIFAQPFRMKPGPYLSGGPMAKGRYPPSEAPRQILGLDRTAKSNAGDSSRLSHAEKLNQLENTFKSVIAQMGPGSTVSSELKHKIKFVVSKFPDGLLLSKLLGEFEMTFKEQLSPKTLGFLNVTELVGALSDILRVEFREGEQDLLVFDADVKPLPTAPSTQGQAEQKPEAKAPVASPPRAPLPAAATKGTPWDCSSKPPREPETRVCKKPNLVVKPLQLQEEANKPQVSRVAPIPDIPPDAVRDKKLSRLPPLDTSTLVGVFVEYIISPSQFYVRIYSRDSSELLEDMMIEMRRCYSNQLVSDRYSMPERYIQPGHLCCVRISEDKWWYRVIIHRVLGKQEVEVFYPDFGNIGAVQTSSLRFLKCCYTKLPAQAIPCSLAWVRPVEEHWTAKAILQFQKLCGLKPLVGVVDEYVDGILNIFLCDTSSNEDVYFHHVLRTEGHAIVCRENVPSKGFRELNPLALYTKASSGPEAAAVTELGHLSLQHYFGEDGEVSAQPKEGESCAPHDASDEKAGSIRKSEPPDGLRERESGSGKTPDLAPPGPIPEPEELREETEEDIPSGMPRLESVTVSGDIWDDSWLPLQAVVGRGEAATPGIPGSPPAGTCAERPTSASPEPLDFSSLPQLEEFYISLIQAQQPAGSPGEPTAPQSPAPDSTPTSAETPAETPTARPGPAESPPENPQDPGDGGSSHAITLFTERSPGAMDQLSLILSPDPQMSQKLYIPRSTATAALGAAARLATSRSFLHWYPSVKRMEV
ncbi:tudor domain-containing protein 5 [Sorex fumeus]|uniref:tudor domain-containing protein 5 n=1 Tax=Sorex fumeus TaxID=62283 RepID=UPI0024ACE4FB|nr:tudor domain-containing protein 5 [Sorex fumeus]